MSAFGVISKNKEENLFYASSALSIKVKICLFSHMSIEPLADNLFWRFRLNCRLIFFLPVAPVKLPRSYALALQGQDKHQVEQGER